MLLVSNTSCEQQFWKNISFASSQVDVLHKMFTFTKKNSCPTTFVILLTHCYFLKWYMLYFITIVKIYTIRTILIYCTNCNSVICKKHVFPRARNVVLIESSLASHRGILPCTLRSLPPPPPHPTTMFYKQLMIPISTVSYKIMFQSLNGLSWTFLTASFNVLQAIDGTNKHGDIRLYFTAKA